MQQLRPNLACLLTEEYSYDFAGDPIGKRLSILKGGNCTGTPIQMTANFIYDTQGKLTSTTYPSINGGAANTTALDTYDFRERRRISDAHSRISMRQGDCHTHLAVMEIPCLECYGHEKRLSEAERAQMWLASIRACISGEVSEMFKEVLDLNETVRVVASDNYFRHVETFHSGHNSGIKLRR